MSEMIWPRTVLLSALIAAVVFSGCGGGSPRSGKVIARVGTTPITEATLRHWTATWIKDDYYQALGRQAPAGLATNPPDYASCVAAARTLRRGNAKGPAPSAVQLRGKCRQLYRAASLQALGYIISLLWHVGQVHELGQTTTDEEVARNMRQIVSERYPTTQALQAHLAQSGFTRADFYYSVKTDLLSTRFLNGLSKKLGDAGGGGQRGLANLILQSNSKWKAKTSCNASYLVLQCSNYRASPESPSVAVLLEQFAQ